MKPFLCVCSLDISIYGGVQIPVIFEGDFWAEEAVRLARAVERKDDTADDGLSPLELCR